MPDAGGKRQPMPRPTRSTELPAESGAAVRRTTATFLKILAVLGVLIAAPFAMGPAAAAIGQPLVGENSVSVIWPRLASSASTNSSFRISWDGPRALFNQPIARYHVQYRLADESVWRPLPSLGAVVTASTSAVFRGRPGRVYFFKVAPENIKGEMGRPVRARTIVPRDDRESAFRVYRGGWRRATGRDLYYGAESRSRRRGATFTYRFQGGRVYLIGGVGPKRGRFAVSIDGGPPEIVDAYSREYRPRQVLWASKPLKPVGIGFGHRLKVTVAGTSGRPMVGIDAVIGF